MGRKETSCLPNLSCDSMEEQKMKVRPVLLKRKSLDTSDLLKHSNHRRNKSQQVRFKEDSTNTNPSGFTELEMKPGENTLLVNGKTEKSHNRSMCLLSYPRSQKLRNIAIQTSPSLKKHFPIFKRKKLIECKPLNEMSTESSCFQVNGDHLGEDITTQLSHLRLAEHLEGGFKRVIRHCPLKQAVPKAQSNGPIGECSKLEFVDMLEKVTVSTQVPDYSMGSTLEEKEESNFILTTDHTIYSDRCNVHFSQPSETHVCPTSKYREIKPEELLTLKPNADCKRIITLTPSLNSNLSYCFHSEHQQTKRSPKDSDSVSLHNDNRTRTLFENDDGLQTVTSAKPEIEKNIRQPESSHCNGSTEGTPCLSKNKTEHETNKGNKERNPEYRAHGEFCSLQGATSIELDKILTTVALARALHVLFTEYDFRQQEGRFHQVLKMLDKVEQSTIVAPVQKPEPDNVFSEKLDLRKKTKKVKKKCFWWI
ncbi:protein INSYN2B isoform X2 [Ascaphus truei]|uniref:protein INSYN2B isoform X2 n=1 Tax=Ascaphus truei TaxID=8439 RepID=UPI003F59310A